VVDVKFFWEEPVSDKFVAQSWEAAFKRPFDYAEWNWRFRSYPGEPDIYAAYVLEEGMVACFVAHTPLVLTTPEHNKLKAGLMLMGFTNPAFQGRGLFTEMSHKINDKLENIGFDYLFAYANNNSHYTNRKHLNWNDVGILTNFCLNRQAVKSLKPSAAFTAEELPLTLELLKELAENAVCKDKYCLERSEDYLVWRTINHPVNVYKAIGIYDNNMIKAVCIYKVYNQSEADIMEIFYKDATEPHKEQMLACLTAHFLEQRIDTVNIWSNLYSDEHLHLEKIGFREDRFSTYFGIIRLGNKTISTDIRDWHYRFLDSDVY